MVTWIRTRHVNSSFHSFLFLHHSPFLSGTLLTYDVDEETLVYPSRRYLFCCKHSPTNSEFEKSNYWRIARHTIFPLWEATLSSHAATFHHRSGTTTNQRLGWFWTIVRYWRFLYLGVDCQISYIHVERNPKQPFIIPDKRGIVHVFSGLALISTLSHPKRKRHERTRTVQAHLWWPWNLYLFNQPLPEFWKKPRRERGWATTALFLYFVFPMRITQHIRFFGCGFSFSLFCFYVLFLHILFFFSPFLCSIFNSATRHYFS